MEEQHSNRSGNREMIVKLIPLSALIAGPNIRKISEERVAVLVESIKENGLMQPIMVRPRPRPDDELADDELAAGEDPTAEETMHADEAMKDSVELEFDDVSEFEIIAGHHRVEAHKRLGWQEIFAHCVVASKPQATLMAIDENLARYEFTDAELLLALGVRREAYMKRHPSTAKGIAGGLASQGLAMGIPSWAQMEADATRKSDRTLRRYAERFEQIGKENLRKVVRTNLDDRLQLKALYDLARIDPDAMQSLVERAASGEAVSATVELAGRTSTRSPALEEAPAIPAEFGDFREDRAAAHSAQNIEEERTSNPDDMPIVGRIPESDTHSDVAAGVEVKPSTNAGAAESDGSESKLGEVSPEQSQTTLNGEVSHFEGSRLDESGVASETKIVGSADVPPAHIPDTLLQDFIEAFRASGRLRLSELREDDGWDSTFVGAVDESFHNGAVFRSASFGDFIGPIVVEGWVKHMEAELEAMEAAPVGSPLIFEPVDVWDMF